MKQIAPVRVLLAEDHLLVMEGFRRLLEAEFDLVGTAADGRELVTQARALHPDVIVLDISMPKMTGFDAMHELQDLKPLPYFVFVTMHRDPAYLRRAMQLGACGYVLKSARPTDLLNAIRSASRGRRYVTPEMERGQPAARAAGKKRHILTSRQIQVLRLMADGRTAKEIAHTLSISSKTVEFHKANIRDALGLQNSAQLISFASKHGILDD